MSVYGAHTTLVDGALSRLSSASPTIAEAMILTTGASLSANMDELVNKTDFAVKLINLPEYVHHWQIVWPLWKMVFIQ